jgi:serine/threonine protein kinase
MDQIPHIFTYKELSKETRKLSTSDILGSTRLGAVYRGTKLSSSSSVNYVISCILHYGIKSWSVGDKLHNCRMGLLVATLLVVWVAAMAPLSAWAQQHYNDTEGYSCNGGDTTCTTYAFYRTYKEQESLATVAGYFNMAPAGIADGSGLSHLDPHAVLPQGLYIPLDCSCAQNYVTRLTSQMQVPYIIHTGDTFSLVAMTTYGALTTYQALEVWNPRMDVTDLVIGDTMVVPIFCACPIAEQIASRTKYLLTYAVYPNETLDVISADFGITTRDLSAANQLPVDATLGNYTSLLVPLVSLPPIATMRFPYVNITQANTISPTSDSSHKRKVGIIAAVFAAGAAAVLVVAGLLTVRRRRRSASSKKQDKLSDFSLVDQNLVLRMFTFKELSKATKNFRRSEILGSGGFGAVYKGTLPSGELVAVKRIRMESKHGQESFRAEVTSLSHIRHRNLVQLRGWCHEEEQLLLVYDYMCNGSLYEWLFQFSERCNRYRKGNLSESLRDAEALPLKLRHSILSGVAGALSYLHEECAQCVLHRDIKSSNVLLDGEWNAYLGDFGLARLIDHRKMARTTMMAGTLGYLAPEMPLTGKATKETDVYSFGILVLEVICGMQPLDVTAIDQGEGLLEDRVWRAHESGNILQAADSRLGTFSLSDPNSSCFGGFESPEASSSFTTSVHVHDDVSPSSSVFISDGAMDESKKMVTNLLQLGLLCCNPSPADRPSMRVVSQLLLQPAEDMEVSMPCLPELKPEVHYLRPGFRGFSQVL